MSKIKTLLFLISIMLLGSFASSNETKEKIYYKKEKKVTIVYKINTDTPLSLKTQIRNKIKSIKNLSDSIKSQQISLTNRQ